MAHDPVLLLVCPGCGRRSVIFSRLGGPQKEMHTNRGAYRPGVRGGASCRYVVTPDPFGGEPDWLEVPNDSRVEDVWREVRRAWDERWSRELLEKVS